MHTRNLLAVTMLLGTMASVPAMAATEGLPEACGKQWTVVDANNDGKVTAQEADAARDLEFARLDQDKDDRISREEWSKCNDLAMSGQIEASAGASGAQGTSSDTASGTQGSQSAMSGSQETTGSASSGTASSADSSANATSGSQDSSQQSASADTQGNQSQSGADQQRLSAYGEQLPPFEQLDKNNDGFVSSMEVADAFKESYESGDVQSASVEDQARRMSSWYFSNDKNADQQLEQTEWTENINRPDAAASAHFDMADANKDGAIDRNEWNQRHQQRWQSAQQDASADDGVTIWRFYMLR